MYIHAYIPEARTNIHLYIPEARTSSSALILVKSWSSEPSVSISFEAPAASTARICACLRACVFVWLRCCYAVPSSRVLCTQIPTAPSSPPGYCPRDGASSRRCTPA